VPYKDRKKHNAWNLAKMKRIRREWFKKSGPCVDCGSWKNLETDHIDPATKVSHKVWSWSEQRRSEELAKCVVRCHDCHRKKTNAQLARPITHGTIAGYHRQCRCLLCRVAMSRYIRDYHKRTRGTKKPWSGSLHALPIEVPYYVPKEGTPDRPGTSLES